jgi:hypothetical protein
MAARIDGLFETAYHLKQHAGSIFCRVFGE